MSGEYIINPLEPKSFGDADKEYDQFTPEAFRRVTRLSQHIAYLKDFFRAYKDFSDEQLDTLEIIITKLYQNFGITNYTELKMVYELVISRVNLLTRAINIIKRIFIVKKHYKNFVLDFILCV